MRCAAMMVLVLKRSVTSGRVEAAHSVRRIALRFESALPATRYGRSSVLAGRHPSLLDLPGGEDDFSPPGCRCFTVPAFRQGAAHALPGCFLRSILVRCRPASCQTYPIPSTIRCCDRTAAPSCRAVERSACQCRRQSRREARCRWYRRYVAACFGCPRDEYRHSPPDPRATRLRR